MSSQLPRSQAWVCSYYQEDDLDPASQVVSREVVEELSDVSHARRRELEHKQISKALDRELRSCGR